MKQLNERQSAFIMALGECFNIILGEVGYKCDTLKERAEVLEALEAFYNGLHQASLEIGNASAEEGEHGEGYNSQEL